MQNEPPARTIRIQKLIRMVENTILERSQMFNPQGTEEDVNETVSGLYFYLTSCLAIAWSIYLADSIQDPDFEIYSDSYLNFECDPKSFLNVLVENVIVHDLLPSYKMGFLVALLHACYLTKRERVQKKLWNDFVLQVSNLFASMCLYQDLGTAIISHYCNQNKPVKSSGLRNSNKIIYMNPRSNGISVR